MYKSLYILTREDQELLPKARIPEIAIVRKILPTLHKRPAEFFTAVVENVALGSLTVEEIELVFQKCTRIRRLVFSVYGETFSWMGNLILPLAPTLECLFSTSHIIDVLAASGVIFPKVKNLDLERTDSDNMALLSFEWLPALEVLNYSVFDEEMELLEILVSTAPNLRKLNVTAYYWAVKQLREWGIGQLFDIEVVDKDLLERTSTIRMWRRLFSYDGFDWYWAILLYSL
ncbi:hypothetical protein H0H92_009781 [Tricholoma furcatifolium]|nr:hypothetical protein H0H92_009781 [Tricholoma furcatifolium]